MSAWIADSISAPALLDIQRGYAYFKIMLNLVLNHGQIAQKKRLKNDRKLKKGDA